MNNMIYKKILVVIFVFGFLIGFFYRDRHICFTQVQGFEVRYQLFRGCQIRTSNDSWQDLSVLSGQ